MSTEAAAHAPSIAPRRIPLKITVTLHVLGVFGQGVFAGQFLSGSDGAVVFHEVEGWVVFGICLLQLVLAFISKRVPLWFPITTVFVFFCEGLQVGTGYGRFMGVHIPLAILTFGIVTAQAVWAFFL